MSESEPRPGLLERAVRSLAARAARTEPRERDEAGAERRVNVLLMTSYGVDGTIRTTLNLAGYLASRGYEVNLLSVYRDRETPFFGDPPPGVSVHVLDDRRPRLPRNFLRPLRAILSRHPSVLIHPDDRAYGRTNLWTDYRLGRALRRRTGFLVSTRPGLNLAAIWLAPPGLVLIGQEHMNLGEHSEALQEEMRRNYPRLELLSVLTPRDREAYQEHLGSKPRVVRIRNAVPDMGDVRADLSAKTVIAAGRLVLQKGYDRLIRVWELVAPHHPDWRLRILGHGPRQGQLESMIAKRGLGDSITLLPPAEDIGAEMAGASIFALSSRWEGLPLVLLEAMEVGMAVISFDCPTGPRSVIKDHENGLLIRPKTIANFAAGLSELMDDAELRERLAAEARERMRDFSMDRIGPRWVEELQNAWRRRERSRARREARRLAAAA
jgi:glycosyltransferase involved in cell wall biosynthesis